MGFRNRARLKAGNIPWSVGGRRTLVLVLILTAAMVLAGCGTGRSGSEDSGVQNDGTEVIRVGSMGTYHPFSYMDEDGSATGYDIEVLKLIGQKDPSLKFEFVQAPWDSLFVGLDAGKYQLLANQMTSNPDRMKRYELTTVPYFSSTAQIIMKKGTVGIQNLDDLKGKTVAVTVGDSFARLVEDWNAANGNVLTVKYYEQDSTAILQDIESGRVDATVNEPVMAQEKARVQGLDVEPVGEPLSSDPVFFVLKKDEAGIELREKLDVALQKAVEDGSLSALQSKWFGEE